MCTFTCEFVPLQLSYQVGCCRSLWSGLALLRWRSDRIQWDTSPFGHRSYAGVQISCGWHLGHGRWSRSSWWCGSRTWQRGVDRLKWVETWGSVKVRWVWSVCVCVCVLLSVDGGELLRKAGVFSGQIGNHLSCNGSSAHSILIQHGGATHIPCDTHRPSQFIPGVSNSPATAITSSFY